MDRISHAEAWLRGIGPYRKIGPMIEKMTLIEKLTNPAWRKSADSEWADLDVAQTVETMREAKAEIERLRALLCKISREQLRIASLTDMTRPAMREAAMDTHNEVVAALEQKGVRDDLTR